MREILLFATLCIGGALLHAQTQTIEVLEYHPAPGQFVNTLPVATAESTHEEVCQTATTNLNKGSMVHLGTYGGYVTVKFDHAVQNKKGSDLRIKGNGFYALGDTLGGSFEPGIVYVGVGESLEDCKWYELAGSEYYTTEIHDFSITYHKPTTEEICDEYVQWEATWTDKNGVARDSTGFHPKNIYHKQSYWPYWESNSETMSFNGGKLPNNAIDKSGKGTYWVQYRYSYDSYGYVDASLNTDIYSTFDIDWAVDEKGEHVDLPEINFVKVVCGLFQYCGWLGETSTEVAGFIDLHLEDGYDDNPIIIKPRTKPSSVEGVVVDGNVIKDDNFYDLMGRIVKDPKPGIYIKNGEKCIVY